MSTISMIPLELRRLRIERAVLTQFGDHLDDAALHELATGPVVQRLNLSANRVDGLDECTREMFALAMLVRLGKVTEADIKQTFASFRRLDLNNDGVLNSRSIIAGMIKKTQQQQRVISALKGPDAKPCTTMNTAVPTSASTTLRDKSLVNTDYGSTRPFATTRPTELVNPSTTSRTSSHHSSERHHSRKQSSASSSLNMPPVAMMVPFSSSSSTTMNHSSTAIDATIINTTVPTRRESSGGGRYWFGRKGSLYMNDDHDNNVIYRYPAVSSTGADHIEPSSDERFSSEEQLYDDDDGSSSTSSSSSAIDEYWIQPSPRFPPSTLHHKYMPPSVTATSAGTTDEKTKLLNHGR
jgi:hypothetical protein